MIARMPSAPPLNLILSSKLGLVAIPKPGLFPPALAGEDSGFDGKDARDLLSTLGRNLGMTLLAAKEELFPEADAGSGDGLALPDEAVRKALESLDAVWIQGGEVVAAFVVEAGAGQWDGVRGLADMLALHPKIKAALYVITVPALKPGLLMEMNRPVYRLLKKNLGEAVRILEWERLENEVRDLGDRVRYLKAEFLEGISEVVEPPAQP